MDGSALLLSGAGPSTFVILSAADGDRTSEKGHVGEIGDDFPGGNDSGFGVTAICRLSVPVDKTPSGQTPRGKCLRW